MKSWIFSSKSPECFTHFHMLFIIFPLNCQRNYGVRNKNGFTWNMNSISTKSVPWGTIDPYHCNNISSFSFINVLTVIWVHSYHAPNSHFVSSPWINYLLTFTKFPLINPSICKLSKLLFSKFKSHCNCGLIRITTQIDIFLSFDIFCFCWSWFQRRR